jgi:hypothetical protein
MIVPKVPIKQKVAPEEVIGWLRKSSRRSVEKVVFNTLGEATKFPLEAQQEILTIMLQKSGSHGVAKSLGTHLPFYHPDVQERILELFSERGALRSEAATFCSAALYFIEMLSPDTLQRVGNITKETMRSQGK